MSYLKFDKDLMINLEYSLYRNVLRTNRKGAYQNTSISGCNTSKYQGLMVMPVPFLNDDNHLILSSIDETVIQHGAEFNLGIHKYHDDNYSPKGHKYIREYNTETVPKTIYRVGGVILSKEIMFSSKENRLMIRYTLINAHSPTIIRFKPFMAFRNISELTLENDQVDRSYRDVENGISTRMYHGYPDLYMQFNKNPEFVYHPYWNKDIEYIQDMQNGDTYKEDLYVPGYFELPIEKGEQIIFSASDILVETEKLAEEFEEELKKRTPRSSFYNNLKNSSHQFHFKPNINETYLLAGYPWFKVRARDQFIALPGCTISVDRADEFVKIMDTAIPQLQDFMDGKQSKHTIKQIDDPDVLLWVTWSLQQYWKENKSIFKAKYVDFLHSIINYILDDRHPNLIIDNDKWLLSTYGQQTPVSWMNNTYMGAPVVPRTGFLVEFNALWYNAVKFTEEVLRETGKEEEANSLAELAEKIKESFVDTFLNDAGYLFDYVNDLYADRNVRPNMIFALSTEYSPLDRRQRKRAIDFITKELLTPVGIRSLSPKAGHYQSKYFGTIEEKENSYFNGTSFPWLIGSYIEAYLKVYGRSGLSLADRIMIELEDQMQNDCIGTLSEFYDSSSPFYAHGGFSFAMSVAEVLRAKKLIKSFG